MRMENYRNKMLRILSRIAAAGRCTNRFFVRKRVHSFSIFHSPFSILNFPLKELLTLTLPLPFNFFDSLMLLLIKFSYEYERR